MGDKDLLVKDEEQGEGLMEVVGIRAIEKATVYAKQLNDIVEKRNLFTQIGDKKHVHVEGWTTLGSMLGIYSEVISLKRVDEDKPKMIEGYLVEMEKWNKYTKKNETFEKFIKTSLYNRKTMKIIKDEAGEEVREVEEIKYMAEIELVILRSGLRFGRAKSLCSNLEEGKLLKDEYSIASMAETRATGKAFRLAFSWIMTLAGYAPTPAEDTEIVNLSTENAVDVEVVSPKPETISEEKPKEEKAKEPVKAKEEETFKLPKDVDEQTETWKKLVQKAKVLNINVKVQMLADTGIEMPPTKSSLKILLPALWKRIKEKEAEKSK